MAGLFSRRVQAARAEIVGGPLAPEIRGWAYFRKVRGGTVVEVSVEGLPDYRPAVDGEDPIGPHGFHIHEFGTCQVGDANDPFQGAGDHYAPDGEPHGNHAGDLPVLFSNNGRAWMKVFTNRFDVEDVIDRTVIIHEHPNDYRSQPAGAAGRRLACGVIRSL